MKRNGLSVFRIMSLAGILSLGMILTGCGGNSGKSAANDSVSDEYRTEAAYSAKEAVGLAPEEAYAEESAVYNGEGSGLRTPQSESEKLIYSGSITLQTLEYDKTVQSIRRKVTETGGFVQYEDESDGNDSWYYNEGSSSRRYAQIQARIPSEKFEGFLESLQEDGQVMNRHVSVDNISQTYAETEASVKAYEIEQERLLEMMDKAETIEDMIAVEARLSEVEAELSRYKTDLASMDRDVEYSTVTISVDEVREYTEEIDDSTFASRLKETVKSSWSGFLMVMEGLLHLIIRLFPFLVVIAVIILIVTALDRKFGEKRRARKAEKAAKKRQKFMERQQHRQGYPGAVPPPQTPSAPDRAVKQDKETK